MAVLPVSERGIETSAVGGVSLSSGSRACFYWNSDPLCLIRSKKVNRFHSGRSAFTLHFRRGPGPTEGVCVGGGRRSGSGKWGVS